MPKDGWDSISVDSEMLEFLSIKKQKYMDKHGYDKDFSFNKWFKTLKNRGRFNEQ